MPDDEAVTLVSPETMRTLLLVRDRDGAWKKTLAAAFERAAADGERRLEEEGGADLSRFVQYIGSAKLLDDESLARIAATQSRGSPNLLRRRAAGDPLLLIVNATDFGFVPRGVTLNHVLDDYNAHVFGAQKNVNGNGQLVVIVDEDQLDDPAKGVEAAALLRLMAQPVTYEAVGLMARLLPLARMEQQLVMAVRNNTIKKSDVEGEREQAWIDAVPTAAKVSFRVTEEQFRNIVKGEAEQEVEVAREMELARIEPYGEHSFIRNASAQASVDDFRDMLSQGLIVYEHIDKGKADEMAYDLAFRRDAKGLPSRTPTDLLLPYSDNHGGVMDDHQGIDNFRNFMHNRWKEKYKERDVNKATLEQLSQLYHEFKKSVISDEARSVAANQQDRVRELERSRANMNGERVPEYSTSVRSDDNVFPNRDLSLMFREYTELLVPAQTYVALKPAVEEAIGDHLERVRERAEEVASMELSVGSGSGPMMHDNLAKARTGDSKATMLDVSTTPAAFVHAFREALPADQRPKLGDLITMLAPYGLGLDVLVTIRSNSLGYAQCERIPCNVPLSKAIDMLERRGGQEQRADLSAKVHRQVGNLFRSAQGPDIASNDLLTNTVTPEQTFLRDEKNLRARPGRRAYAQLPITNTELAGRTLRVHGMGEVGTHFVGKREASKILGRHARIVPWKEELRRVTVRAMLNSVLVCGLSPLDMMQRSKATSLLEALDDHLACQRRTLAPLLQQREAAAAPMVHGAADPLAAWFMSATDD